MLINVKLCVDLPTAFNAIYAIEFDGEKVRIRYEAWIQICTASFKL